jgi:uncharacterized membrane protein YccF (DUF307 family)
MTILGNILWIVLGGLLLFVEYLASGIVLCCTIVGIPFGFQCFKLAVVALAPFGVEIGDTPRADGCLSVLMNILWILIGDIWISLTHLALALLFAITIIGLPFALQHIKLAGLALTPFGREIR